MRRIRPSNLVLLSILLAAAPALAQLPSPSPGQPELRTPARQYGSAYSIKIKLVRGEFDWVIPVWVKPDAPHSTLDGSLMRLMGWAEPKFEFDEVSIAGTPIDKKVFGQTRSDWAYFPDFAKSCCVGILGRDVLDDFEIRFDPRNPTHLVWKKLPPKTGKAAASKSRIPPGELQGIFNLRGTNYKKLDLTLTPYTLNLRDNRLEFDAAAAAAEKKATAPVFAFDFVPPSRNVEVLAVRRDVRDSASRAGLKVGTTVTRLDNSSIGKLDRVELDYILRGRKQDKITLTLSNQKEIDFDFKKNEFTAAPAVPSRPR